MCDLKFPFSILDMTFNLHHAATDFGYLLICFLFQVKQSYTKAVVPCSGVVKPVPSGRGFVFKYQFFLNGLIFGRRQCGFIEFPGKVTFGPKFHQAVILGHHVKPAFEISYRYFLVLPAL